MVPAATGAWSRGGAGGDGEVWSQGGAGGGCDHGIGYADSRVLFTGIMVVIVITEFGMRVITEFGGRSRGGFPRDHGAGRVRASCRVQAW